MALNYYNPLELTEFERAVGWPFMLKPVLFSIPHTVSIPKCFELIVVKINSGSNNSTIVIWIYRPLSLMLGLLII